MAIERKPPKEVQCQCGNLLVVDRKRDWCTQCGRAVYHDPKDQLRHKINNIYMMALILAAFTVLGYLFVEMIASPMLRFQ